MRRTITFPLLAFSSCSLLACSDAVVGPDDDGAGASSNGVSSSADVTSTGTTTSQSSPSSATGTSTGEGGGDGDGGAGGGGAGPCEDACDLDDRSCLDDGVITCVEGASGCTIWSAAEPCPADAPYCGSGTCSAECHDECEPNDLRCRDEGVQHCYATATPDGPCFRWEPTESCEPDNACLLGTCEAGTGCVTTPITCEDPPESECVDDDTLRVWDSSGLCEPDGSCSYEQNDVDCSNCPSCDACENVVCDDPPSVCYEASGTCTDGSCGYDFADDEGCDDGDPCTDDDTCASGVCAGDAVVCDDPPPPACVDDDTLRTYSGPGSCGGGDCTYDFIDDVCPDGCEAGACVGGWRATSVAACPFGRIYHSAVWTGQHMIVWGGDPGGQGTPDYTNTGGRYDPTTDSWQPTTTVGAPTGRADHTAIWTNAAMIVWGGIDTTGNYTNTGGRYDPASNSWASMSTVNAPPNGASHEAVWTGTEMIVWGGESTKGRYNPGSNSWAAIQTAGAPSNRAGHSMVWTGTEAIVWGGAWSDVTNTGGRYDPATNTWTNTSTLGAPTPRMDHTAVWTGTEMIVWGGVDDVVGGTRLATGGRYNPATDTWTSLPDAPVGRQVHTAVWTGSQMIVWSGLQQLGNESNTGHIYDRSANAWTATPVAGAPSIRYLQTAVWSGSEMIVWGGAGQGAFLFTGGRYAP